MIFSRPCEYAIRALFCLADAPVGALRADQIALAEDIPLPILSKVLQDLVRKGLLDSRRGPGGGFRLSRRPELILLRDVVAAIDGLDHFYLCVTGLPGCSDEAPCPLHEMWKQMRANLTNSFETITLDVMARGITRKMQSLPHGKSRAPR
jgi:Rrf2 family iron-sulfur cluster assembly transcriptional regulator